ncbi:hypothetical protein [uncultured Sphingomonas sp.]|uniref:hypothetical protein n=1 Tax=uncultured Sphingomonas sp. TaxID=158754 RepID=UPI0035CA371B
MMRRVAAIVVAVIVAILAVSLVEWLGYLAFPADLPVDSADRAALAQAMAGVPLSAKLIVVFGWVAGTYVGASIALRLAQWRPVGWIVAAIVITGGVWNLIQLPHPWWMQVMTVVAPLAGCWLAERRHRRARPGDPLIG